VAWAAAGAVVRSPWTWTFVALAVRAAYVLAGTGLDGAPWSDAVDYHRLAARLAEGRGFTLGPDDAPYPTTFRPPLLPALIAPFYALFGPRYGIGLLVQAILGALVVPAAAALAAESARAAGRDEVTAARARTLTAILVALWPAARPAPVLVSPAVQVSGPTATEPVVRPLDALQEPPSPRRMPGQRFRESARAVAPPRYRAPVVIVDDRQRAALSGLMRLVAEGKLTGQAFAHTTPQSMGAIREQVIPLSVTPVEVNPIPVGGVSQSGAERN